MKTRKFKIPTWFIEDELCHKVSISYDHETERAYQLLDIIYSKLKYDRRKKFNSIEILVSCVFRSCFTFRSDMRKKV